MTGSQTPETDALISVGLENADRECVPAEFGRKLERERDEAREKYDNLAAEHMLVVNKICGERDDALNQITGWENKWKVAVEMAAIAENDVSNLQDQVDLAMKVIKRLEANKP
jgi:hypothetical protein